ncbi:TPM domain-containing protein [Microbacterium sp. KSW4-11]|uniref:TPM domain-containing protein n=1 Tax=Microbacterium gawkjiense TaxID=3067309 RepID=A0ABU3GDD3_9MICO|nr:TPM domain-containing protein [Microbacterium sp. KSW4-11]MDT3317819.1 TPM domain-containing protein [Microbacterium sp. KSW4-11]
MRSRLTSVVAVSLAVLIGVAVAAPAAATEPVTLDETRVLDASDVLTDAQEARLDTRLAQLQDDTGLGLWVVYVDDFTDPSSAEDWANATAERNNLGPNQYLLAVATEGRAYYLSADSSGPISPDAVARIEQERVLPALSNDDWAGAGTAAADGLQEARSGGGGGGLVWVVVIVVAALAALVVWALVRRRRRRRGAGAASGKAQVPLEELERQAGAALVRTDDAISTSTQELGFAKAEFGDAATGEFEQAIAEARASLQQAFALQQKMDDETPDSPEQRRAWYAEILERSRAAEAALVEKAGAFEALRDLAANAPEALARVQQRRAEVGARAAESDARLTQLRAAYRAEALSAVADNPEQARDRLTFADARLAEAQREVAAGDGAAAAVGIRAAEQAVAQATQLQDAITKLAADFEAAERDGAALVTELEADLAAAAATPDPDARLAPVIAATRQNLDAAREDLTGAHRDPLAALTLLERANTAIDGALGQVREAQQRADRARSVLSQTLLQARAQISAAEDFITARRGAVGATARTRLAEAGATLVQATQAQDGDPERALALAQRAASLAEEATRRAQSDVGSFAGGGNAGGGGDFGGMLGGIIMGSLLSGGGSRRSSGGFGGFGGGSSRRSGGRSGGSIGRSSGGSRSRRGGGRF